MKNRGGQRLQPRSWNWGEHAHHPVGNPVNTGLSRRQPCMFWHPDRCRYCLNSDTEVNWRWLIVLHHHAGGDPLIGTGDAIFQQCHDFQLSAFHADNPLLEAGLWQCWMRCLPRSTPARRWNMPRRSVFCHVYTRRCLKQVGYFDTAAFESAT